MTHITKNADQNVPSNVDFVHPELLSGEVFFSNANSRVFRWMKWKSKRKGIVAYDGEGRITGKGKADWFPVFIKAYEMEKGRFTLGDMRRSVRSFIEASC